MLDTYNLHWAVGYSFESVSIGLAIKAYDLHNVTGK